MKSDENILALKARIAVLEAELCMLKWNDARDIDKNHVHIQSDYKTDYDRSVSPCGWIEQ